MRLMYYFYKNTILSKSFWTVLSLSPFSLSDPFLQTFPTNRNDFRKVFQNKIRCSQSPDLDARFSPFLFFFFLITFVCHRYTSLYIDIHIEYTYINCVTPTSLRSHAQDHVHLARHPPFILKHPSHACLRADCVYMNAVLDISCASLYLRALSHILFLSLSRILSLSFSLYHAYIISLHSIVSRQLHVCDVCDVCLVSDVCLLFVKTLFTFISFFYTLLSAIFLVDYGVFPVFFLQPVVARLNTISL